MLRICNLTVSINSNIIVKDFTLTLEPGSLHAIMGQNGSGKSTLAATLMGHPAYRVEHGSIHYGDQDITALAPDKRARLGLFLVPQYSPEIPGVCVFNFLKEAYQARIQGAVDVHDFKKMVHEHMAFLGMHESFAQRSVHEGFSGGEKKRLEILQLLVLQPSCIILDEVDSGLDIDALRLVAVALEAMRTKNPSMSILLITHYQRILSHLTPDFVHIMQAGTLVRSGTHALAEDLERYGYARVTDTHKHDAV